jgi:adenosylmethionine-8-amino-7-oxononanoate aminotransferase
VNTYGGHPVATAVALRNIEIVEREGLVERAAKMGRQLLESLQNRLDHPQVGDVRGLGLLIGIELVQDRATREPLSGDAAARVVKHCAREGVIVGRTVNTAPGFSNVLIVAPPFTLSESEAELLVGTLEGALTKELGAGFRG